VHLEGEGEVAAVEASGFPFVAEGVVEGVENCVWVGCFVLD
jgi:hypothetical protein